MNTIEPKNSSLIWLVVKAWVLGIVAFAMLFALIFVFEIDYSLPTATPTKVIVTYLMATLFMLLSTTLFSFPMMIVGGMIAYLLHTPILRHPWIATLTWTFIGFTIYRILLHRFGEIADRSLFEWVAGYALTREGIATLIALLISSAYFCFKLRAKMLAEFPHLDT
jgi:hypothetical protein